MNFISAFILIVTLAEGYDWCPLIKPNDTFKGLGLYHRYQEWGKSDFVMFNRAGHEWRVTLTKQPQIVIEPNDKSIKSIDDKNVVNRFGTFSASSEDIEDVIGKPRDCTVISEDQNSCQIVCRDVYNGESGLNYTGNTEFVIMKAHPSDNSREKGGDVLIFNRYKKAEYFVFNVFDKSINLIVDCMSKHVKCEVPPFVQQMDDSLFGQIDAVIDFNHKNDKSGHLILFNVDGRPKYCSIVEGESLSEECKFPEKMTPFVDQCFPSESTAKVEEEEESTETQSQGIDPVLSNTETPPPSKEPEKSSNLLLIIIVLIIIVLILIVGAIIGFGVYQKSRKNSLKTTEESLTQRKSESKRMDKTSADQTNNTSNKNSDKTVVSSKK